MKITLQSLKFPWIDIGPIKSFFREYGFLIWSYAIDLVVLGVLIAGAVFSFKQLSPMIGAVVIIGAVWYIFQRVFLR